MLWSSTRICRDALRCVHACACSTMTTACREEKMRWGFFALSSTVYHYNCLSLSTIACQSVHTTITDRLLLCLSSTLWVGHASLFLYLAACLLLSAAPMPVTVCLAVTFSVSQSVGQNVLANSDRQSVCRSVCFFCLPVRMIFHKLSICAVDAFREREEREFSVDPVFQRICMELRRNKRDMIIRVPPSFRDDRWM